VSAETLLQAAGFVAIWLGVVLCVAYMVARRRGNNAMAARLDSPSDWLLITGDSLYAAGAFLRGDWAAGAFFAAMAALIAWRWWRRRRKRRRNAPGLAGYKARAALARLAQRARDAAQPRPVLRPAPGGAR
jgi:hypothetical protein